MIILAWLAKPVDLPLFSGRLGSKKSGDDPPSPAPHQPARNESFSLERQGTAGAQRWTGLLSEGSTHSRE
ncbi:hypothetical protein NPX13_g6749 [Xylaria arbuscula]|uniref:Uncharacterized protein n=1 Tax=Xylaria arbuscula TaxID=114810 RepID=A0A9W8TL40_9PEZI|nr:hypothetical protein NPX13_g6749 [Xylaria arbuscula]